MYGDQFGEFLSTYILGLKGLRGLTKRGAYNNPRWLISTIKESSWKQALAVCCCQNMLHLLAFN